MIRKLIFYFLMISAALLVACFALAQTPQFKTYCIQRLCAHLQDRSGWSIEVGDIGGVFPFYSKLSDVVLRDPGGDAVVSCGRITVLLSPHHLVLGNPQAHIHLYLSDTVSLGGICRYSEGDIQCDRMVLTADLKTYGVAEAISADCDMEFEGECIELQLSSSAIPFNDHLLTNGLAALSIDTQKRTGLFTAHGNLDQTPLEMRCEIGFNKEDDKKLHIDNMQLSSTHGQVTGNAVFDILHHTLQADLVASGNLSSVLTHGSQQHIEAQITTHASVEFSDSLTTWHASITSTGEIAPILQALIDDDTNAISGIASLQADVMCDCGKIDFKATIHIQDASYELLSTGAIIKEIDALFEGNRHQLSLVRLHGTDGKGGTATATGYINLDLGQYCPFALNLDLQQVNILHQDYADGTATGTLQLVGDSNGAYLSGTLEVTAAEITVPEQSPANLTVIDVTYTNQPDDEALPKHFAATPTTWPLQLDVKLHMPNHALVKAKNLVSEWHGDIHLTGTTDAPLLHGTAHAIDGKYFCNGKTFTNQQSSITFAGDPVHKTMLYMTAMTELEECRIEAVFKGPVSDPKLSFHSNPPMSEKEILSWLLFNKGLREITPFEQTELAETIVTLSGSSGGDDLLGRLQHSLGIDRVDISSSDTGTSKNVSLRVGKYLWNGLFLSLNKGISSDTNEVAIEAHLTNRLKFQAEISDNAEGKLHLKWKRDY